MCCASLLETVTGAGHSWLTLGLYRMRVPSLSSEREAGVLRASGKVVWTWPPVGAVDAGPMQIQLRKGVSVRCAEAVLWSATHDTAGAEDWLGRKSSAKTVVEEVIADVRTSPNLYD